MCVCVHIVGACVCLRLFMCDLSAKPRKIRFEDDEEIEDDVPEKDTRLKLGKRRKKKSTSAGGVSALQARMLQMAGQEVPDALSESSSSDSDSDDDREENVRDLLFAFERKTLADIE